MCTNSSYTSTATASVGPYPFKTDVTTTFDIQTNISVEGTYNYQFVVIQKNKVLSSQLVSSYYYYPNEAFNGTIQFPLNRVPTDVSISLVIYYNENTLAANCTLQISFSNLLTIGAFILTYLI